MKTTERLADTAAVLVILQRMEQNLETRRMKNQALKDELSQAKQELSRVRQQLQEVRTTLSLNPQPTRVHA